MIIYFDRMFEVPARLYVISCSHPYSGGRSHAERPALDCQCVGFDSELHTALGAQLVSAQRCMSFLVHIPTAVGAHRLSAQYWARRRGYYPVAAFKRTYI